MKLSLVVPCYNEQKSLESFSKEIFSILDSISKDHSNTTLTFECIFVNDGSKDNTIELLLALKAMQTPPPPPVSANLHK